MHGVFARLADPNSTSAVNLAADRVTDTVYDGGSQRVATETTYAGDPPQPRPTNGSIGKDGTDAS